MTTAIRHDHDITQFLKSASFSMLALSPSLMAGMYLADNRTLLQAPYLMDYALLALAALDMAAVLLLEPYRRQFSRLTFPALIGAATVILLFVIAYALSRFFGHMGYVFLTPLVVLCLGLICATVFAERNIALKFYLSLNSVAVMLLWALGSIDKITMPF
jgi:hypothetical protein